MEKSYAERADSATTFDPELQFDREVERELEEDEEVSVLRNKGELK